MGGVPPVAYRAEVLPEWLDYNGHLNEAYYLLVFSRATDALLDAVGMGDAYRRRERASVFTLETHLRYLREVRGGETVEVEVRLLGLDAKRAHLFCAMRREGEAEEAATAETLWLHVDTDARRGTPFRAEVRARLEAMLAREAGRVPPEGVGRSVGLGRR